MNQDKIKNELRTFRILVINPGSSSTKIAVYDNDQAIFEKNIEHSYSELKEYKNIVDQYCFRKNTIIEALESAGIGLITLNALVARGGFIYPLEGGTYRINGVMVEHLKMGIQGHHASNLAGIIADDFAKTLNIPAFTVDPVVVDELHQLARITGLKGLERKCIFHALNFKAVARKVALDLGKEYSDVNLILVHLGTGISVGVSHKGKITDVTNPFSSGPFSPERCGGLPSEELVNLCYSGKYTHEEMINLLYKEGGLYSYLGTKDVRDVEKWMEEGHREARLILEAMAYQIAKAICEMSAVVCGDVDRIIITGGMAKSKFITDATISRVDWIAPVVVVPGENELSALVNGALRVLQGKEAVKEYKPNKAENSVLGGRSDGTTKL